jgi:hypothetical protein
VLPHAGPWARDPSGFDEEVQFSGSRDCAVLRPNHRGSTGTLWIFASGERWEFVKMHDDVTAAPRPSGRLVFHRAGAAKKLVVTYCVTSRRGAAPEKS